MPHTVATTPQPIRRAAQRGVVSVLFAGIALVLLAILGVSLYAGITTYIQSEMHEAANAAAGAAARAVYDLSDDEGRPIYNANYGIGVGTQAYVNFLASSSVLGNFSPALQLREMSRHHFRARIQGAIQVPLLARVGLGPFIIRAESHARYMQNEVGGTCGTDPFDSCINTQTGPYSRMVALDLPVYNGPGMDLFINTGQAGGGYHGIQVQVCTTGGDGGTAGCQDVAQGAYPYQDGVIINRNGRQILYGRFFVDLDDAGINKGTALRIEDDGVHDNYSVGGLNIKGTRKLELIPFTTQPASLRTMHHALLCREEGCAPPNARLLSPTTGDFDYP